MPGYTACTICGVNVEAVIRDENGVEQATVPMERVEDADLPPFMLAWFRSVRPVTVYAGETPELRVVE